jgi:mannosylglycerate hydrolase
MYDKLSLRCVSIHAIISCGAVDMDEHRQGKILHILTHTHWDREWFINSPYVNEWLPGLFREVFRRLEEDPEYCFICDGQMAMIEDCITEQCRLGQDPRGFTEKLTNLVKKGQLILGPYYVQPDWQLVSGEALIRNLLVGRRLANDLGGAMGSGWLLDNFGQISQAVQIHAGFGLRGIFVWRGVEMGDKPLSEFWWESPDGSRLPCVFLISGYRNGMNLGSDPDLVGERITRAADQAAPYAKTGQILLMNGYDQETKLDDIGNILTGIRNRIGGYWVRRSSPDVFIRAISEGIDGSDTPILRGALYNGRYISVFPGVLSSRMDLKRRNHFTQNLLEHYVEPLCVFAHWLGADIPRPQLDKLWRLLLKNHPHDSICGVSADPVGRDMHRRYDRCDTLARKLITGALGWLCGSTDTTPFRDAVKVFTVLNSGLKSVPALIPIPAERGYLLLANGERIPTQKITGKLLGEIEIPGGGMVSLGLYDDQEAETIPSSIAKDPKQENFSFENDFYIAAVDEDGTLRIKNKQTGREYRNLGPVEDGGDNGDTYNYAPPEFDEILTTTGIKAERTLLINGPLCKVVHIRMIMKIPAALNKTGNRQKRSRKQVSLSLFITVECRRNSPVIRFRTRWCNTARDHRLRVLFPTGLSVKESLASTPFDVTSHPVSQPVWPPLPRELENLFLGARETVQAGLYAQNGFVCMEDGTEGLCLLNRGLPEYESLPEQGVAALTLLRSIGCIAQPDIVTRKGDAGPQIAAPEALCLGFMEAEYGVFCYTGSWAAGGVMEQALFYDRPPLIIENTIHPGSLPGLYSFLNLKGGKGIGQSALKPTETDNTAVLRLYNPADKRASTVLAGLSLDTAVYDCNLAEERLRFRRREKNGYFLELKAKKIESFILENPSLPQGIFIPIPGFSWAVLPEGEDELNSIVPPPSVTWRDVQQEYRRADQLWRKREKILNLLKQESYKQDIATVESAGTQGLTSTRNIKTAGLTAKRETLNRTFLEARLSALMLEETWRRRRGETPGGSSRMTELLEELRISAAELRLARVAKRTGDILYELVTKRI